MSEDPAGEPIECALEHPDDDEFCNGSAVEVTTVKAGTTLWRFVELDPPYDVSTFNPNISPHHERPTGAQLGEQGRFDPLDRAHGGYVYCSPTLGGAVAEGILRGKRIPASHIVPAIQVDGRALVRWQLHVDIDVAALHDPHLRQLSLISAIHSCSRRDYGWSRRVAHAVLAHNPHRHGLIYPCRNDTGSRALLVVHRPRGPLTEPDAYSLVDVRAPVDDVSLRYDIAHKLSALVDRAEATHGIITITRHGKPAAVLMSVDDLESLQETIYWLSRPGTAESVAVVDREYAAGRTTSLEELRARSDTESITPRPEEVTVLHQPR